MTEKIIKKTVSFAFAAVLFIIFAVLSAVTLLLDKGTYSYFENRELAKFPEYSFESVLSGEYFTGIDTYISDRAAGRNTVIKLSAYADLYLLRRPVVNEILITDGVLLADTEYEFDEADVNEKSEIIAERLTSHKALTESYGGKFLYTALPTQDMVFSEKIPDCVENRVGGLYKTGEIFFRKLEERGVDYIDMTPVLSAEHYSTVDHHYNIGGAYETAKAIAEALGGIYVPELDGFEIRTFDEPYLGSRARKLYGLYNSDEKLSVMIPKEEIPFRRWFYGSEIDPTYFTAPTGEYATYDVYMGGDYAVTKIDTGRGELPDILIYGDSFTNAVESILWTGAGTMTSIDFRGYDGMTLEEYIAEYKPDFVICIRDYSALLTLDGNGA